MEEIAKAIKGLIFAVLFAGYVNACTTPRHNGLEDRMDKISSDLNRIQQTLQNR